MNIILHFFDFLLDYSIKILCFSAIILIIFIAGMLTYNLFIQNIKYKNIKINFYHPIIKKTYYDLLDHEKNTNEVRHYLIKQNNHMNRFYPYDKLEDRFTQIQKNHGIQTIFNYLKFDIKKTI
jgi:hypothetical protein